MVEWLTWEGQPAVVLDRTAFYPTSDGHPSDRGILCDVLVVSVEVRETDGTVIHRQVAACPVPMTSTSPRTWST